MLHKALLACASFLLAIPFVAGADQPTIPARLTAAQIVERNQSARGGLTAWRAVASMRMAGKIEAGGKQNAQLPFVLDMKRPRKARIELQFEGQTAVQVYDGNNGWKLRPFLGRHEVERYSSEEMKQASTNADLDGPLMDCVAKGTTVEVEGAEKVADRDAYRLKLTLKDGDVQHVWVDAQTFLEVKVDGAPRRLDGKLHAVATYFRDYKPVHGLMIPHVFETAVEGVTQSEKITIESVVLNPPLDDALFTKPN